jgi:hypothetical protein
VKYRRSLHHAGCANLLLRKPVLDLLEPALRAEAIFEILWQRTTTFAPIDVQLAVALTELVDARPSRLKGEPGSEVLLTGPIAAPSSLWLRTYAISRTAWGSAEPRKMPILSETGSRSRAGPKPVAN